MLYKSNANVEKILLIFTEFSFKNTFLRFF